MVRTRRQRYGHEFISSYPTSLTTSLPLGRVIHDMSQNLIKSPSPLGAVHPELFIQLSPYLYPKNPRRSTRIRFSGSSKCNPKAARAINSVYTGYAACVHFAFIIVRKFWIISIHEPIGGGDNALPIFTVSPALTRRDFYVERFESCEFGAVQFHG